MQSLNCLFVVGSGSPLLREVFSPGYSGFPLSSKTNISKFQFDQESGKRKTAFWMCYLQIIIYLFNYLFSNVNYQIQRKEVDDHLQSTTRLHLAFTCSTFQATTEKLDALQKQVEELKTSNCSLNAKVEAQKQEITDVNIALGEKLDIQKREWTAANSALASKVDAQKRELSSANSALRAQVDAQKREWSNANSALTSVVEAHKREWRAAKSELDSKVELQTKEIRRLTNETSPFVWKITGFNEVLRLAKEGTQKSIYNEFYTGKRGYKLKVRVDPDGDQSHRNRYLSAYVGIMKGHYDPILPWPFRQQVTFTVIDQQCDPSNRKNEVGILNTEQQIPGCFSGRPTSEENPELRGVRRLISHKVLFTRRYVEYDTLFLRVEVGPHD